MRLANGRPNFDTRPIEPLWTSKIDNIETLREQMQGATLVAFDIESAFNTTTELGLSTLVVNQNNPHACIGRRRFQDENHVQAFTFEIGAKSNQGNQWLYRRDMVQRVWSDQEAAAAIEKTLRRFRKAGRLILVGYDAYVEFRWLCEHPTLASQFSAWCDVQELLSVHSEGAQIGLGHALHGLQIIDNRLGLTGHSAASDTVRTLAILAALLDGKEFVPPPPPPRIPSYNYTPNYKSFTPRAPFCNSVRISNESGGFLPRRKPEDLIQLYGAFDLKAVGMNPGARGGRGVAIKWWIAFNSAQSMQEFIGEVNGSEVDAQRLVVIPFPIPTTTQSVHRKVSDSSDSPQDDVEAEVGIGGLFAQD